jgi:hypothetical protein
MRSIWIAPALSGALTGLARKNNGTQAKAWAEFPRPFGPKPSPTHTWAKFSRPFGPGHNGHRGAPRLSPYHLWASRCAEVFALPFMGIAVRRGFRPTIYGHRGAPRFSPCHLWASRRAEVLPSLTNGFLAKARRASRAHQEYFAPSISLAFLMLSGRKIMRPFFVCGPPAK